MEELLPRLIEKVENRYYGKYRAFVVDNADPENRGRLRLRIPSVLGNDVVSGWALPCAPYGGAADQGLFFIPEIDAGVWVEFEGGDLDYPIWVGCFWGKPGGATEVPKPADGQSPPTSKIIKTLNHTIELADEGGQEAIKISDEKNNNMIIFDNDGITIQDANGNSIVLNSSNLTLTSNKGIKVGESAAEPLVLGNLLKTTLDNWFNTVFLPHMHTGNLGAPTTPPVGAIAPILDSTLSQQHKVE